MWRLPRYCSRFRFSLWKWLSPLGPPSCGTQKSRYRFLYFTFFHLIWLLRRQALKDRAESFRSMQSEAGKSVDIDWDLNIQGSNRCSDSHVGIKRVIVRYDLSMFVFPLCFFFAITCFATWTCFWFWWTSMQHRGPVGVSNHGQDAEQHLSVWSVHCRPHMYRYT